MSICINVHPADIDTEALCISQPYKECLNEETLRKRITLPILSCTGAFMDEHNHPHFPRPPAKPCCMLYPGNSVCFNTEHLTTISTDARTVRPAKKGAMSSSQQLGNSGFSTQSLPESPRTARASQQQLRQLPGADPRGGDGDDTPVESC